MSASQKRHDTLRAIIRGSLLYQQAPEFAQIDAELQELSNCRRVNPDRRKRLLQVIHSTRALDSALGTLLTLHGHIPADSLGPRMNQLKNLPAAQRGHLSQATIDTLRKAICRKRNRFVHNANAYPTSTMEVDSLVADIHTCFSALM
jgi:hypothetical protein